MKIFLTILMFVPLISKAGVGEDSVYYNAKDSLHSSLIISVEYDQDTLYIKARHYAICCEQFVAYNDFTPKEGYGIINIVYKNLDDDCLCTSEKIIFHKMYFKDLGEVKFKINGIYPRFGLLDYKDPNAIIILPKKRKKKKKNKD